VAISQHGTSVLLVEKTGVPGENCIFESGVKHHNHNPNPQVTDTKKQKDKQSELNTIGNELI
jgi:hypothetical protein